MGFDLDSLWDGIKDTAKRGGEVATFIMTAGGSSAIEKSVAAYQDKLRNHGVSAETFQAAESAFKSDVGLLGKETEECMKLLADAKDLVERLSYSKMRSEIPTLPGFSRPDLRSVRETIAQFDSAIVAGKGVGLGVAASTGAWILVAHLGTASTGAAIAGLSGAAAHSAILAWFGGGALAAGGGGMALGAFTIGGLVALPLIAFSAFKSYKEAFRIDEERKTVEAASETNYRNAEELELVRLEVVKLRGEVIEKRTKFVLEFGSIREEASKLAYKMASSANLFAADLLASSRARGATM
jgi:hypothetical protein